MIMQVTPITHPGRQWLTRLGALVAGIGLGIGLVIGLGMASPAAAANDDEPLRCWWRTSVSAVKVGEPFTLVLTCAALQTESTTAVVDRARLDPRAIELAPFDVLGGSVAPDVAAGDRLFFQIEYHLRFVNEAFFNQDVALPDLAVNYRIQTRGAGQDAATQGMERRLAMPRQSLRVTSLVPADATDIRDAAGVTFAQLDARSSRGRLLTTAGLILIGLAGVVAVVGVGRTVGARTRPTLVDSGLCSEAAVLRSAARELAHVREARSEGGWSVPTVARALAATRVVAECALDRTPHQQLAARAEAAPSGALTVTRRWRSGPPVLVSSAVTPKSLTAELTRRTTYGEPRAADLDVLLGALTTFTNAAYTEGAPLDDAGLDEALASVERIARRLAILRTWLVQRLTLRAWRRPAPAEHGATA